MQNQISFNSVLLKELVPQKDNPRKNRETVKKLKEIISEVGFLIPILVNSDKEILAGHSRYQAAKALKMQFVPVVVASHLTEKQQKFFTMADNKVAGLSKWDEKKLKTYIEAHEIEVADLELAGFNELEIENVAMEGLDENVDFSGLGESTDTTEDDSEVDETTLEGGSKPGKQVSFTLRCSKEEKDFIMDALNRKCEELEQEHETVHSRLDALIQVLS